MGRSFGLALLAAILLSPSLASAQTLEIKTGDVGYVSWWYKESAQGTSASQVHIYYPDWIIENPSTGLVESCVPRAGDEITVVGYGKLYYRTAVLVRITNSTTQPLWYGEEHTTVATLPVQENAFCQEGKLAFIFGNEFIKTNQKKSEERFRLKPLKAGDDERYPIPSVRSVFEDDASRAMSSYIGRKDLPSMEALERKMEKEVVAQLLAEEQQAVK